MLTPGQVRRVRARERTDETPEGSGGVLEVWIDLVGEPPEDRRAVARGLFEGGMVRIAESSFRPELSGKIGKLVRFPSATVEVDGRGISCPSWTWNRSKNRRSLGPILTGTFRPDGRDAGTIN